MAKHRINRIEWVARIDIKTAFDSDKTSDQVIEEVTEYHRNNPDLYRFVDYFIEDDGTTLCYRVVANDDPETGRQEELSAGVLLGLDLKVNPETVEGEVSVCDYETGREFSKLKIGREEEKK